MAINGLLCLRRKGYDLDTRAQYGDLKKTWLGEPERAMIKLLVGLFIGIMLTGVLFLGPLSPEPAKGQFEDLSADVWTESVKAYYQALNSSLQEAGDEIQDEDLKQFYWKLKQEYGLDKLASEIAQDEYPDPTEVLPDIENINRTAITLPLEEAGKNIKSEDIARFYYRFLRDAGWEIEPD